MLPFNDRNIARGHAIILTINWPEAEKSFQETPFFMRARIFTNSLSFGVFLRDHFEALLGTIKLWVVGKFVWRHPKEHKLQKYATGKKLF